MNWYDWILPTNMLGGIMFGTIISVIYAYLIKRETNSWFKANMSFVAGIIMSLILVWVLKILEWI
ncbi:hypothetical protein [Bacillus sp. Marseille-P3661]|uniref:hypothetical protein n=1 Tax=Bacillus sp. Marseille-P3661 TaxID=1936234 RepID=UPI000C8264C6|nr:hypothetical protein [Bacillus sp. Marseille-P3661]